MPKIVVSVIFVLLALAAALDVAAEKPDAASGLFLEPEAMVASVYSAVSSQAGSMPDWQLVRSYFDPDAVIVLRASREESKKLDVDGFIQDFVDFYDRIENEKRGFAETVVSTKTLEYGNIAHIYVVYEAAILDSDRPPQRGLDSWHLMKNDGRWWVVSVVNDSEPASGPIPEEVFGE
jgi:hypothetical protein